MVKNYQKGKIYRIYCLSGEEGDEYIGSSCRDYLCQRWGQHRAGYRQWKQGKCNKCYSYDLFDKYGLDNCIIELLEEYPCDTVEQLNRKEGEYIKQRKCINRIIAGQTKNEFCILYRAIPENRERQKERQRARYSEYRKKNKDKQNEQQRIRRSLLKKIYINIV